MFISLMQNVTCKSYRSCRFSDYHDIDLLNPIKKGSEMKSLTRSEILGMLVGDKGFVSFWVSVSFHI